MSAIRLCLEKGDQQGVDLIRVSGAHAMRRAGDHLQRIGRPIVSSFIFAEAIFAE
jgi:hypothetical protein